MGDVGEHYPQERGTKGGAISELIPFYSKRMDNLARVRKKAGEGPWPTSEARTWHPT